MAVRVTNLGSGGTQDALLKQLLEQYGGQSTPKVPGISRVLAPLTGIGSIIDAYYDARYGEKDAGILNVLKNYALNLGQGVGTLFTGTNYEKDQRMQGASELLDKAVPGFKQSAIGKNTIGRIGVDIVGGLLTDPTTYIGFGPASLADDTIRGALKASNVGPKTIKNILPKLAGGTTDDIVKTLASMEKVGKQLGPEVADKFYVNVIQTVGKSAAKSGALKTFGKTITQNPTAVGITKGIVSPLGAGLSGLDWASKKFTPGTRANFLDTFNPVQGAIEAGKGDEAVRLLKFNREASSIKRGVFGDLLDAELPKDYEALSEAERGSIAKKIEATRETAYEASKVEGILKRKKELTKALKEYIGGDVGELDVIWPDQRPQLGLFEDNGIENLLVSEEGRKKLLSSNNKLDAFYRSLDDDQKPLLDPILARIDELGGKKVTDKEISEIISGVFGNQIDREGKLLALPKGLSENERKFISDYFAFERGQTKKLEELGIPTISARKMGYISREPIGYRPRMLKSTLKRKGFGDAYEKVMSDKRVLKDLADENLGYVRKETLEKVLNEDEMAAFKKYNPGMIGEMISGGGAKEKRVFETLEQAEAAGLVYGKNPLKNVYEQTIRQNEQILAAKFAKDMVSGSDYFVSKPSGLMTIPVTVPGVGRFYTDKHMAKIADDYLSKYVTEEGINKMLTSFDKIQSLWKRSVTGMGPNIIPYNIRNLLDDNIRLVTWGADVGKLPDDYSLALDIFKYEDLINKVGKEEALKQIDQGRAAKFLESVGVKADNPIDELWNRCVKNGVYSDVGKTASEMQLEQPQIIREALGLGESEKLGERLEQKVESVATGKGKVLRREQATRMATFFNFWRKEGAQSAGLDAVKNISFNYNELTKPEREIFRRVVPFYGFVKNNIKFYLELLKDNPEKLARYFNVYEGIQSGSQGMFGEEWEAMPEYVKESLSIPFSKTKEGELKYLSGLNLGIEGLADVPVIGGEGSLRRAAGNLSPELSMLIELLTGKDLFRGEDILEGNQGYNYENRSELLKKLMNYQKYPVELEGGRSYEKQTVAPETKYLLENLPFVSALNTGAKRASDLRDKDRVLEALTNMLFPARINKGNVEDAKQKIEKKQQEDLYKLLQRKGIADVYKSFYIPKGLREQLFNQN